MTEPAAAPSAPSSSVPTTLRGVLAVILRQLVIVTIAVTVIGVVVGLIVAGSHGLWGALIGGLVGVIFCATTVVTMLVSEGRSPQFLAIAVLGGWLAKMLVIIIILAVIRDMDFYNRYVLAATLAAIVISSLVIEMRAVSSARIPNVEPVTRAE